MTSIQMTYKAQTTGAKCQACAGKIYRGELIVRIRMGKFEHLQCPLELT